MEARGFKIHWRAAIVGGIACLLIISLAFLILPINTLDLDNIAVNPENGDVAIIREDAVAKHKIVLALYNKEGTKLFQKSIINNGKTSAKIAFCGENVYVYASISGEFHGFGRKGEPLTSYELTAEDVSQNDFFEGWKSSFGKETYEACGLVYTYERPLPFRHKARLTVTDGNETRIIYED